MSAGYDPNCGKELSTKDQLRMAVAINGVLDDTTAMQVEGYHRGTTMLRHLKDTYSTASGAAAQDAWREFQALTCKNPQQYYEKARRLVNQMTKAGAKADKHFIAQTFLTNSGDTGYWAASKLA